MTRYVGLLILPVFISTQYCSSGVFPRPVMANVRLITDGKHTGTWWCGTQT